MSKNRTGLTKENIFEKTKYANIFSLILWATSNNKKIRFKHLRFALCLNHGDLSLNDKKIKEYEAFFKPPYLDKVHDNFKRMYKEGVITKNERDQLIKNSGYGELHRLRKFGMLNEKTMFKDYQVLRKYRGNMIKIGVIDKLPKDKKKYCYYVPTKEGVEAYDRYFLKWLILNKVPAEKLDDLRRIVMNFI